MTHEAFAINFVYIFLKVTTEVTGSKPKPLMIIMDGSMAMWNAVLLEFSNETRAKYCNRCWRIIMGNAKPGANVCLQLLKPRDESSKKFSGETLS